jgi:hypothetical protein
MLRIVLYHQPALDVTNRVVKEFDLSRISSGGMVT